MKKIKVGSDFSGVGAFNQALMRLGIDYEEVFACDMDKYARQTFIQNYGEPKYYPVDVYERKIPSESLDIYLSSPPCQAFSLAGYRLGKDDKRGILFFNSYEFIKENKPRFFIFENVKGLLSDDNGKTFSEWINMLGGKSVNGDPIMFPYDECVPYHIYWKIINAKDHGVPQNRDRIFIVGIRDDKDNNFRFPIEETLTKTMIDLLEDQVDEKYFLSEKMIDYISKDRNGDHNLIVNREVANTITCEIKKMQRSMQDNYVKLQSASNKISANSCKYGFYTCALSKHDFCDNCEDGSDYEMDYSLNEYKIRRLTPRECFRLMDFPDTFSWTCSDTQAYRQAGNSIVVNVLCKILKRLPI